MSKWEMHRDGSKIGLEHRDLSTLQSFDCGVIEGGWSDQQVVDWIIQHGTTNPGDLIVLSNKKTLYYSFQHGVA